MTEPGLGELLEMSLVVPIRSSTGEAVDPLRVPVEAMRHGADEGGRFLAAYTSPDVFREFGPPGSDAIELPARDVFARAEAAAERVVIDPGAPAQIEVPAAVLPFLAAGIDPTTPEAMRARRPYGELPPLEAPNEVPQPFGAELQRELAEMPRSIERGCCAPERAGPLASCWRTARTSPPSTRCATACMRLANEHLAGHRDLAVTDLSAAGVREAYESVAGPWYVRPPEKPKGIMGRLFGD